METSEQKRSKNIYDYLLYFLVAFIILSMAPFIFGRLSIFELISSGIIIICCIGGYIFVKKIETNENSKFRGLRIVKFKSLIAKQKYLIGKILTKISSLYGFLPIILGILAPMFFTIIYLWYFSWILFGMGDLSSWALYYYIIPNDQIQAWIVSEIIIFCIGGSIFLTGLIAMIKGKKRGDKLIKIGIYKYIRHPQNLGIIIFTLPFMLFIPGFKDLGIRMGDILSWSCFAFLQILSSFLEEISLIKRYSTEFLEYYKNTGFFLPKLREMNFNIPQSINYKKKSFFSLTFFIVYVNIFRFLLQIFSANFILFRSFLS
ncbi:MAG: methyltransferase family protein [Promethearchaeota archaeon]